MPDRLALAAEFPAASREQWRELVSAVLAKTGVDGDPEAALTGHTYDGIAVKPLYTAADLPGTERHLPGGAAHKGAWDVRQRHCASQRGATERDGTEGDSIERDGTDGDGADINAAVRADLAAGATSAWLVDVPDLAAALDGVDLAGTPIALDAGAHTAAAADALWRLCEDRVVPRDALRGTLGADPIGLQARTGVAADLELLRTLAAAAAGSPQLHVATVDATVYHDAGTSDAQEVGIATAVGVAYLRALCDAGLAVDDALARLEFRFALNADQFAGIAKLRAARRVWARVAELSGAASVPPQWQHAVTSAAMLTRRDAWVNLLRATVACFAAAVGGADAITVLPFDTALGASDEFARRLARNTSAILHDESSLARVVDAAGGSWYVEAFSDQLARSAWDVFVAIERTGGAQAALQSGMLAGLAGVTRTQRDYDIAHRRAPLTGVSEFAFLEEAPVPRPPAPAARTGGVLAPHRYAEPFEQLRDRADAAPSRPTVFLAALGPVGAHTARLSFARNLFAAGGIASVVGTGSSDDLITAFQDSGSPVACLCSSDAVYAASAESEAAALKAAGAKQVWLAGQPGVALDRYACAGVDGYLYAGCDALEVLHAALDALGVA